jgi:hypothetical protein
VNDELNLNSSTVETLHGRRDKLISTYQNYDNIQLDILTLDAEDTEIQSI